MEDITLFLWIGGLIALALQYYVRVSPIFFIGELLGIGGLITTFQEVDAQSLGADVGMLMTIAMVVVILYSTLNLINYYWPTSEKRWKL